MRSQRFSSARCYLCCSKRRSDSLAQMNFYLVQTTLCRSVLAWREMAVCQQDRVGHRPVIQRASSWWVSSVDNNSYCTKLVRDIVVVAQPPLLGHHNIRCLAKLSFPETVGMHDLFLTVGNWCGCSGLPGYFLRTFFEYLCLLANCKLEERRQTALEKECYIQSIWQVSNNGTGYNGSDFVTKQKGLGESPGPGNLPADATCSVPTPSTLAGRTSIPTPFTLEF